MNFEEFRDHVCCEVDQTYDDKKRYTSIYPMFVSDRIDVVGIFNSEECQHIAAERLWALLHEDDDNGISAD